MIAPSKKPWHERLKRPSSAFPRHFVPNHTRLSVWDDLLPLLTDLKTRELPDEKAFHQWLQDLWEFSDALGEESSRLYILMTCDTRDKERESAYLHFVEEIDPKLSPLQDELNRKALAHPLLASMPEDPFGPWRQSLKVSVELYCEENIPLYTEIAKLSQQYQKICGEMTVEWEGEKKTLSQMAPYLQSADREKREMAWKKVAERRLESADALEDIFDEMLKLRQKVAQNLGLANYVEYAFKSNMRTDYTPQDCFAFHQAVEKVVVPIFREAGEIRRHQMGLDKLRPWDMSCDPLGRPPLKPFTEPERLIEGVGKIFSKLDNELHGLYEHMVSEGLMDLENRLGKAPGGYQSSLSEIREPFIFMNAVGMNEDVFTLLHESGHAFHYLLARKLDPPHNRHAPMEFSEVASMAMERLGAKYIEEFYSPEEKLRAVRSENEEVFRLLCWVAIVDAFQHWIYTTPHTRAERQSKWLELDNRFGALVDWSGFEKSKMNGWHRQLHIFEVPFYYIEYGIAQLGALQVWLKSIHDEGEALRFYKQGLSLGGRKGLKGLFEGTGLKFDFSEAGIAPLLNEVRNEWKKSVGVA